MAISIGFVVRNTVTGEMLAERPDGPVGFVRTVFSPDIAPTRGDALRMVAHLGAYMDLLWRMANDREGKDQTQLDKYEAERSEWDSFLQGSEVAELFVG